MSEKQQIQVNKSEDPVDKTDVVDHHRFPRVKSQMAIYMRCLNAAMGIFFFGFNQGIFNVVQLAILNLKGITDDSEKSLYEALMTSFNPLGGLIGALVGTYLLHWLGTIKRSFYLIDILGTIGTGIILIDTELANICVGRFIQGLAQGLNTALVPLYIKDFSPLSMSGKTGSFAQLGQKGGLVLAYLMGLALPTKHKLKEDNYDYSAEDEADYVWRIVLSIPIIFCIIRSTLLTCVFTEDRPMEQLKKNAEEDLQHYLHNVYDDLDFNDVYQNEIKKFQFLQIKEQHEQQHEHDDHETQQNGDGKVQGPPVTVHDQEDEEHQSDGQTQAVLVDQEKDHQNKIMAMKQRGISVEITEKEAKEPFQYDPNELTLEQAEKEEEEFERIEASTKCRRNILGWTISLTVSFSGIDAIFYYSNKIFEEGGLENEAIYITIGIGACAILFSFVGMSVVDKWGRRPLLLAGSWIMCFGLIGLVVGDALDEIVIVIVAVAVFMFGYNATLGPIKWACYVELMDPFGVSVAAALIFVFAFLIGLLFPFMVQGIELSGSFGVFLGLSIYCLIYLTVEFKETKGLTQREIYSKFCSQMVEKYDTKPNPSKSQIHANVNVLMLQGHSQMFLSKHGGEQFEGGQSFHKNVYRNFSKSFHKN